MTYLLDTNVFIQAKNLHYGFDFCPGFWDWLTAANGQNRVFSIGGVRSELVAGADELAEWAGERREKFFLEPDASIVPALGEVSTWATNEDYEPTAVNTFLQATDYYLVAHALARRYCVVTHELFSTSKKKIKIPNACLGLGVRCLSPFDMLRREQVRLCLETTL